MVKLKYGTPQAPAYRLNTTKTTTTKPPISTMPIRMRSAFRQRRWATGKGCPTRSRNRTNSYFLTAISTEVSSATITSTLVNRSSLSQSSRSVSTRPRASGGQVGQGVKSSSTIMPP